MKGFGALGAVQFSALAMIIIGALSAVALSALLDDLDGPEAMIFLAILPVMFAVVAINLLWSMAHGIICWAEAKRARSAAVGYLEFHGFSAGVVFVFTVFILAAIFGREIGDETMLVALVGMPVWMLLPFVASFWGLRAIRKDSPLVEADIAE